MSSSKRFNLFHDAAVIKNLSIAKMPAYGAYYNRLFLTRRAAEFILSAILVFSGFELIIVNSFFSPVWPFAGVALSGLFLRGNTLLAGIFVGTLSCFACYYAIAMSLSQAAIFTIIMYLTREACLKIVGPIAPLAFVTVLWKFIFICAFFCACHVSLIGFLFVKNFQTSVSWFGWLTAFLGELNGILCLTPLCLAFTPFTLEKYLKQKPKKWLWLSALIILCQLSFFFVQTTKMNILLASLFCMVMIVYALSFGLIPLCVTLFGSSIIYLAGALPQGHLFHQNAPQLNTLIILILFSITIVISLSIATFRQPYYFKKS